MRSVNSVSLGWREGSAIEREREREKEKERGREKRGREWKIGIGSIRTLEETER